MLISKTTGKPDLLDSTTDMQSPASYMELPLEVPSGKQKKQLRVAR